MAFIYYDKAKLRSNVLAITIRLLLFLQAYSSILAGIFSFCFYIQTTEAKNLTKNYLNSENQNGIKNRTEMLQEAEAEAEVEPEPEEDPWKDLELPFRDWVLVLTAVVVFWFFLSCCLLFACGPKAVECHLCEEPIPNKLWNKKGHWTSCANAHERFVNELPDTEYRCPTCDNFMKVWPRNNNPNGPNVFKCQIGQECDPKKEEKLAKNGAGKDGANAGEKGAAPAANYHPSLNNGSSPELEDRQSISVANNGESRYCCFEDGFDVCNLCAEEAEYMTVSYATLGIKLSSIIQASTLASTLNHPIDIAATSTSNGSSASKQLNGGWFDVQLKTISQTVQETSEISSEKNNGMVRNGKVIMVQNEV